MPAGRRSRAEREGEEGAVAQRGAVGWAGHRAPCECPQLPALPETSELLRSSPVRAAAGCVNPSGAEAQGSGAVSAAQLQGAQGSVC